jgi:hypothetical protein
VTKYDPKLEPRFRKGTGGERDIRDEKPAERKYKCKCCGDISPIDGIPFVVRLHKEGNPIKKDFKVRFCLRCFLLFKKMLLKFIGIENGNVEIIGENRGDGE